MVTHLCADFAARRKTEVYQSGGRGTLDKKDAVWYNWASIVGGIHGDCHMGFQEEYG